MAQTGQACAWCGGKGRVRCQGCGGAGRTPLRGAPAPLRRGLGALNPACRQCSPDGTAPGTGQMICPRCAGSGKRR